MTAARTAVLAMVVLVAGVGILRLRRTTPPNESLAATPKEPAVIDSVGIESAEIEVADDESADSDTTGVSGSSNPAATDSSREQAVLLLKIAGIKEPAGEIRVALFAGSEGYPEEEHAIHLQSFPVAALADGVAPDPIALDPVEPGRYAMAVYHDVDDNGKMNRALVGYPTEPYGFSNNARATFGPPAYDKAEFEAVAGEQTLELQLK